ncbi:MULTISPECIES: DNA primase [unclassified Oceanispirochaeta]|uniref:DNA primase n=1 Tax=unclassified Oceanispirochaeta TaxID=2635722 RepID=UPI000E097693|nr:MULTISPECIES: DNA primase [unclassified Oceanispirochaeta]MBF9016095.1 DNA primase [Oceanispirochaeta sp. M2]NPD72558.1 DNA primase [Oceanispirochaeta sp. M1]RDG32013.1 DNA primase [Oceanispirochaeta sp. M1]
MSMRIPELLIEEIKEKTDILGIVGEYSTLKRKGDRYWGCCPFHNEKTPSFSVRPEQGMYYCFGCHKGGSLFNFIMEVEGLSFIEAVRFAAEKAGVPLPEDAAESQEEVIQRNSLKDLYKRASGSFHYILMNNDQAAPVRQYLADRGIHKDTIERFQLGYAPDDPKWLYSFLKNRNYSDDFLASSGLFSKKYASWSLFSDRLMFPIFSNRGEVVAFSGRTMKKNDPKAPKYINSPETALYNKSKLLYGLWQSRDELRKSKTFYLCEGNVDVVALHQAGIESAMAPLGTAFTDDQSRLLKRYSDQGFILFDSDSAGQKATYKAGIVFERLELPVKVIKLPEKSDPAEILEKEGAETLKKMLKSPVNLFEYLLDLAMVSYDISTPEGKEQAVKELFPYIESIASEIKRDLCLGTLAEKLGIESKSLLFELNRQRSNFSRKVVNKPQPRIQEQKMTDELLLVMTAALHREFAEIVKQYTGEFDFQDERAILLYNVLIDCEKNNESSTESLLAGISDDSVKRIIMEKISTGELDENTSELIDKTLLLLRRRNLQNRSREINRIMSQVSKEDSSWELVNELIIEKQNLDKEIEELKVRE